MKTHLLLIVCFILIFFAFGCLKKVEIGFGGYSIKTELSQDDSHWGGYKYNQEYVLQEDVFLQNYALVPQASSRFKSPYYIVPKSPESYESSNQQKIFSEYNIQGIVRKGTTVITTKLIKDYTCSLFFGCGDTYLIYGRILDGDFAGTPIEDFKGVSVFQSGRLVDIKSFSPQIELIKTKE